jgi:4'-phosphopantetheinyl transferase
MNTPTWESPPENISLAKHHVHVWRMWLRPTDSLIGEMYSLLSVEEKQRSDRFKIREDRTRYIAAHYHTRKILSKYLALSPEKIKFAYSQFGKPVLAGEKNAPGLRFNLSHSVDIALLAVTNGFNLGIDLELVKQEKATEDIARRFFSIGEVESLLDQPKKDRQEAFFRCWTRKEAYIKARGEGMSIPLGEFEVSFLPGDPPRILWVKDDPHGVENWTIFHLAPETGYVGALAVEGHPEKLNLFNLGEDWDQNP